MTESKMTQWYNFKTGIHDLTTGTPPDNNLENYLPQDMCSLYWDYINITGLSPREAYMKTTNVILSGKG